MERVDVEQRAEKARRFFLEGYNCAQAVVLAYCDLFDISPSLAASISAPLGGGMGRLREVLRYLPEETSECPVMHVRMCG